MKRIVLMLAAVFVAPAMEAAPVFDVVSVKPHVQGSGFTPLRCSNGRYVSKGFPLVHVIDWAYELNTDQSRQVEEHLPRWLSPTTAYDIEAKTEWSANESECRSMMQEMLAERFKLAAHWESKEARVSDLVIARGGPKLQKALESEQGSGVNITLNGTPIIGLRTGQPKGMTMAELATFLTQGRRIEPIMDKTGLEGRYKIDLKFSLQPAGGNQELEDPDLETALQQQLGLKLEKRKGVVRLLIVDRIEPPAPN